MLKRAIKQVGRKLRVEIVPGPQPDMFDFFKSRNIDLILDVGANTGVFGHYLRRWGYTGEIVSYEPSSMDYARLVEAAKQDGRWMAHQFALGDKPGRLTLNISDMTLFNSFLDTTEEATKFNRRSAVVRREEVEVKRLDDVTSPYRERNILLKIDTQGFERNVLEGARNTLQLVKGVLLELPIFHLYRDTWSFTEAVEYMRSAGFEIAQLKPVNFHADDGVSLLEVDCLFRRDPLGT